MVNIEAVNIKFDDIKSSKNGGWYTYVDFNLSESKKRLGIIDKKITYDGDSFLLLVTSSGEISDLDTDVTAEELQKRFTQDSFDEKSVSEYIKRKVSEASNEDTIDNAYSHLKQYFVVDDYVPHV